VPPVRAARISVGSRIGVSGVLGLAGRCALLFNQ
jgi:hypothetical protein